MAKSKIQWTGHSWNPVVGCNVCSPGCRNCYAMRDAWRKQSHPNEKISTKYAGTVEKTKAGQLLWTGKLNFSEEALREPLRRKVPTTYFVNSMSDLFHPAMPVELIDRIFAVMILCHQHTFQILTKRSDLMRMYLQVHRWHRWSAIGREIDPKRWNELPPIMGGDLTPVPNVWLGVSVEDQQRADERIPDLLATPAAVRFLSCEPLLGPIDLNHIACERDPHDPYTDWKFDALMTGSSAEFISNGYWYSGDAPERTTALDWIIAGGESGPSARPMHPHWLRTLRDQCQAADVPFFFKQWGDWVGGTYQGDLIGDQVTFPVWGKVPAHDWGDGIFSARIGKKRAGRGFIDREWNEMPEVHHG